MTGGRFGQVSMTKRELGSIQPIGFTVAFASAAGSFVKARQAAASSAASAGGNGCPEAGSACSGEQRHGFFAKLPPAEAEPGVTKATPDEVSASVGLSSSLSDYTSMTRSDFRPASPEEAMTAKKRPGWLRAGHESLL